MSLVPVDEALARLLEGVEPLNDGSEILPLDQAAERILAKDLVASRSQPPFPASAMDGYAVRAQDTQTVDALLTVIGEAAAGHGFHGSVARGEAVRIFTGAPVPSGADAILIQENAEKSKANASAIRVLEPVERGRFVRPEGLDFKSGDTVLKAGSLLDAGRLTAAAAMNHAHLPVLRRPRIAILATGDELVRPGQSPADDQIIASNTYGVAALARQAGGDVIDLGIAVDRQSAIEASIDAANQAGADILVTLGGASVGDHDLVQAALTERGMTLDFWKIAMRPGKPLMSGRLGAMHVLGLPGNPVSSLVCSHLFLMPLTARLAGRPYRPNISQARLAIAMGENDRRQDYVRARLSRAFDGTLIAEPFQKQDSSMMRVFAEADGLIIRPPFAGPAPAGAPCDVLLVRSV